MIKNKNHFGDRLFYSIRKKGNYLCLGIDPHLNLIPKVFQKKIKITNATYSKNNVKIVENFCKNLINTIGDLVPVIKINEYKNIMTSNNVRCDVIFYKDAKHGFFNRGEDFIDTVYKSDLFLKSNGYLSGDPTIKN